MKQIAALLDVSPGTVHNWTADIDIDPEHAKRNRAAGRETFGKVWAEINREKRRGYQQQGREHAQTADALHMAGCMLFWAEGSKSRNSLSFANSDVRMVQFFRRFLTKCFGIAAEDLTLRLNVYLGNGMELEEIENWWLRHLDLPRSCLRKSMINHFPTSSSGKKVNRLPYGVCTLRVCRSTWLVQHIYGAIQEYGGFDEPRWLDGPPRHRAREASAK